MFPKFFVATAIAALLSAPAVFAEQYVVQIDAPFDGARAGLLQSLKVVEIDAFTHEGTHYMVIEAPDEGYVEAYFFAIKRTPKALHTLGADWTAPGLASLPLEQRLPFLAPAACGFCVS